MKRLARLGNTFLAEMVKVPEGGEVPPPKRGIPSSKHSRLAKQVGVIVALRVQGYSNDEIAGLLDIGRATLQRVLYQARQEYGFDDVIPQLQHKAIPQAIENLNKGLAAGDQTYTLETLRGLGLFKSHQAIKSESEGKQDQTMVVRFEMPEGGPVSAQLGQIVGAGRLPAIEGEVVPDAQK